MMSVFTKPKLLILIITSSFLLAAGFWVPLHTPGPMEVKKGDDRARRLLQQAAPAPWSRTERDMATLQQYVRDNPNSARNRTRLGAVYLQKTRETADPSYLSKAEELFKKALELDGKDFEAMAGMGSLCLSRDRKSTRLNSSHIQKSRMPSSA